VVSKIALGPGGRPEVKGPGGPIGKRLSTQRSGKGREGIQSVTPREGIGLLA